MYWFVSSCTWISSKDTINSSFGTPLVFPSWCKYDREYELGVFYYVAISSQNIVSVRIYSTECTNRLGDFDCESCLIWWKFISHCQTTNISILMKLSCWITIAIATYLKYEWNLTNDNRDVSAQTDGQNDGMTKIVYPMAYWIYMSIMNRVMTFYFFFHAEHLQCAWLSLHLHQIK